MTYIKTEIKISHIKFFQSVKIGNTEKVFLTNADYDISLYPETQLILITDKKNSPCRVFTTVANAPWMCPCTDEPIFQPEEEQKVEEKPVEVKVEKGSLPDLKSKKSATVNKKR